MLSSPLLVALLVFQLLLVSCLIGVCLVALVVLRKIDRSPALLERVRTAFRPPEPQVASRPPFPPNLLDNLNHELRSPLTAIRASSQILLEDLASEYQELAEMIVDNGHRLEKTISELLDWIELESQPYPVQFEEVDVVEEIEKATAPFKEMAEQKGIQFILHPARPAVWTQTDPRVLRKVIGHLADNAVKFTAEGGIDIDIAPDTSGLRIKIKDTGLGMSPGFIPTAFDPFYQEDTGLDRSYDGCGLGLTLAERFTSLLGGEIKVSSAGEEGTTFTVTLPQVEALQLPSEASSY